MPQWQQHLRYTAPNAHVMTYTHPPNPRAQPSALRATLITDNLPNSRSHAWRYITLSPSRQRLYVSIGAPFNVGECVYPFCGIVSLGVEGSGAGRIEPFAAGIRNAAAFTWRPGGGEVMYVSGMGRDNLFDADISEVGGGSAPTPSPSWIGACDGSSLCCGTNHIRIHAAIDDSCCAACRRTRQTTWCLKSLLPAWILGFLIVTGWALGIQS